MPLFKNILVVRTDRIGDVVVTIPAIRALKKTYPDAKLTVLVSGSTAPLIQGLSFIDDILIEEPSGEWCGYWKLVSRLRQKRFDLAVIYHTKRRINSACFFAGIPVRLGYKNKKFGFLLTAPVLDERHLGKKHEAEYCLDLLEPLGVKSDGFPPELASNPVAEAWASDFFKTNGLSGQTVVALHPDSTCATKRWPIDSFVEVADNLAKQGVKVVVIGGASAQPFAKIMKQKAQRSFLDLTGALTLSQLVAFLRRSACLVSNDSGPGHVAAACGIPVITLFFRNQPGLNPERWKPLGNKSILLMNKPGEEIVIDQDSRILKGRLDSITPQEVLTAIHQACPQITPSRP